MTAAHSASTLDFISLAHTMTQLRTLAGDLSSSSAFESWMPCEDSDSRYEQECNRIKNAEAGTALYLELARAAMDLVGRPYDGMVGTPLKNAQSKTVLHQIGIDLAAAPSTIQVSHVLPLIEQASQLMKVIAFSVKPRFASRAGTTENQHPVEHLFH